MCFQHWAVPARKKRNRNKRNTPALCQTSGKRVSFCFVRFLFIWFYLVFYPAAFLSSLFYGIDWIPFPAYRTILPVMPRLRPPTVLLLSDSIHNPRGRRHPSIPPPPHRLFLHSASKAADAEPACIPSYTAPPAPLHPDLQSDLHNLPARIHTAHQNTPARR